jgi:polar amino acid transport system substrate-binding protein
VRPMKRGIRSGRGASAPLEGRLALIAVALLAVGAASCGHRGSSALARVREAGVLRWGGDMQGGEPYVMEDPDQPGRLMGFEVELADAIARELGVRAEFVQNDWENLVPSLGRGSFDIAMNGLEVTPARADTVQFTRPYFIFSAQLVARRDDDTVTDLASLQGRRVGTLSNSFSYDILQENDVEVVSYQGTEEPYADLEGHRVDGVLLDDIIASRYGLVRPSLHLVQDVDEGYYAIACRRPDQDLCEAIDDALATIAASGEARRIFARWNIDSDREERLASWTDDDTHTMLLSREHVSFGMHHVVLFLEGAGVTLFVSTLAMMLAVLFGLQLALARMYGPKPLSYVATTYVEVVRGTPVLLQLYILYYGVMPWLRVQFHFDDLTRYDAMVAAIVGLGLNYAAYEAEIYRAGIQAIPPGQMEAAKVLGMSQMLALRRVIVPQAVRIALPGMTNDFIALLKDSSLVSVITVVELSKQMQITGVEVRSWLIPGLLCAALYMGMSYPLSVLSRKLEERLARNP